ncbi:MAG: hypothetical protein PHW10_06060 [Candidatus Peribacteraceae bacterium]|nr:hypothetical protein [Candidatus Peribacteraceae bacterium]
MVGMVVQMGRIFHEVCGGGWRKPRKPKKPLLRPAFAEATAGKQGFGGQAKKPRRSFVGCFCSPHPLPPSPATLFSKDNFFLFFSNIEGKKKEMCVVLWLFSLGGLFGADRNKQSTSPFSPLHFLGNKEIDLVFEKRDGRRGEGMR